MDEADDHRGGEVIQRLQSSFGTSSSSLPKQPLSSMGNRFEVPHLNTSQIRAPFRNFSHNFSPENSSKRAGMPPSHPHFPPASPYSQIPSAAARPPAQQVSPAAPSHSRSLSQPAIFSFDSLPPMSPSPYRDSSPPSLSDPMSADISMEDMSSHTPPPPSPFARGSGSSGVRVSESLPPRKSHRRSHSEIPFGFASGIPLSPPVAPIRPPGGVLDRSASARENLVMSKPAQLVKQESDWDRDGGNGNMEGTGERKSEGEAAADDLFSAYMNLDNMDALNSGGASDKQCNENREDLDSRASGTKTGESSDNEAESSVNESGVSSRANRSSSTERKEGTKRSATGDATLNAGATRHCRSLSMDSFMGKMHSFGDESPKLPPSPGLQPGHHSRNNSMDGNSAPFSLDFGNGEFSGAEMKKIMANEKLAEIALTDPKRAKRWCGFH